MICRIQDDRTAPWPGAPLRRAGPVAGRGAGLSAFRCVRGSGRGRRRFPARRCATLQPHAVGGAKPTAWARRRRGAGSAGLRGLSARRCDTDGGGRHLPARAPQRGGKLNCVEFSSKGFRLQQRGVPSPPKPGALQACFAGRPLRRRVRPAGNGISTSGRSTTTGAARHCSRSLRSSCSAFSFLSPIRCVISL